MTSYVSTNYIGHTVKYNPTLKRTRRVGGWVLEWEPHRPNTVWAIPQHLKAFKRASSGTYYGQATSTRAAIGWDLPLPPAYVRQVAPAFIIQCQKQHTATEGGNQ